MSRFTHTLARYRRSLTARVDLAMYGGGALTFVGAWLVTGPIADILRDATNTNTTNSENAKGSIDLFALVDKLLAKGLWIVVALAPLGMAWGAGAMIFGGRSGPQIMGASIVAVVLVAAAHGIAL